jgi:hypothetical protein
VIIDTPTFQILNEAMKGMKHVIYLTTYSFHGHQKFTNSCMNCGPFSLLEDRDFKGFWMKIKVTLNQIFSNFNTICISTLIFLETLHQLLHQFTFLSIPSLQVCFHHMSYNQCFDVNSEPLKSLSSKREKGPQFMDSKCQFHHNRI